MGNISFDQSQHSAASHLVSLEQVAQNSWTREKFGCAYGGFGERIYAQIIER